MPRRPAASFAAVRRGPQPRVTLAPVRGFPGLLGNFAAFSIFKAGIRFQEDDRDFARGPVSLLADDQLGLDTEFRRALFGLLAGLPLAEDEYHDVRVLLDRAGLAEVGELRSLPRTLFGRPAQLRERDDRHLELLRDALQASRDEADLLRPVFEPPVAADELEVVHDEEVEVFLFGLEPPGLGADLHDAERRRVLNIEWGFGEAAERLRHPGPVLARGKA